MTDDYAERVQQELSHYARVENVHDLPPIFHYWSGGHLLPLMRQFGFESIDQFFSRWIVEQCRDSPEQTIDAISLGSGNGDLELQVAQRIREAGLSNFRITRLELNDEMRARAEADAREAGLGQHFVDIRADLNSWEGKHPYQVVMANHSLHHVVDLEHLFNEVQSALPDNGVLLVNDMVGRNGHMRWPEALAIIDEIWSAMDDRYKYNHLLARHEETYENWDCSMEGFEGIRAQDILPLLSSKFFPQEFLAFANVIDLFVDRCFGHNFDPARQEDRDFIDRVALLDESALSLGIIKPTHLIAVYRRNPIEARWQGNMSPEFALRRPDLLVDSQEVVFGEAMSPMESPGIPEAAAFEEPATLDDKRPPALRTGVFLRDGSLLRQLTIRCAESIGPIRRLRSQRNALSAEIATLNEQLASQRPA